jgi:hypothetical protein
MTLEMLELYPYKNDKFLATLEMFELYWNLDSAVKKSCGAYLPQAVYGAGSTWWGDSSNCIVI